MKRKRVFIVGVIFALLCTMCACGTNNDIEDDIIDIANPYLIPGASGTTLISEQQEDIQVIPDNYNTGCTEDKLTVVEKDGIYNEILIKLVDGNTKFGLDFGYSNKDVEGDVYFDSFDFSKLQFCCRNEHKVDRKICVHFTNCKFSYFSSGIGESNLSYTFENCSFNEFAGSNATFDHCKFGSSYRDCLIPYSNVKVTNSYFRDLNYFMAEGGVHSDGTQLYGDASTIISEIYFDSCRFEIPVIRMSGNKAAINACLNFQTEYNDADNVHFSNSIINGGGYSIYAWSKTGKAIANVSFDNISVGGARLFGTLYPIVADTITFSNIYDTPMLYATSCYKDENGLVHATITNDTLEERTLRIYYTEEQFKEIVVPACRGGNDLRYTEDKLSYSDFPFDIDITIPEADNFIVLYDVTDEEPSEATQIRFVNFTDDNVYLDLSEEIEEDIIEIYEEVVTEEVNDGSSDPDTQGVIVYAVEESPEDPVVPAETEQAGYVIASGQCGDYVTYSLESNGTLILSGMGATYNYHTGKLPPWFDSRDIVLKVVVEEGINVLGQYLFPEMPNLREVVLPSTLTLIGRSVFIKDKNISDVSLPENLSFIGSYAFAGATSLKSVYVRQSTWDSMLVETANDPIANNLVFIDNDPVPEPVRLVAQSGECGKTISYVLYEDGELVISGSGNMYDYHTAKVAPWYELRSAITRVTFEGNITRIGEQSFRNCILIDSVDIPRGVSVVGKNAFIGCSSLQNVTIPNTVSSVGSYAFAGTALTSSLFDGSESQWNEVEVGSANTALLDSISFR